MNGRMRTWIVAAVTALMTVVVLSWSSGTAWAAGDPSLDGAIDITPPAGWVAEPTAMSSAEIVQLEQAQTAAAGASLRFASKGWIQPNSTNQITVTLESFPSELLSAVQRNVRSETVRCGPGQAPASRPVPGIPGSKETACSASSGGAAAAATTGTYGFTDLVWFDGDIVAVIRANGLPNAQVDADARRIAAAIPTGGVARSVPTLEFVLIGLGVVVAALATGVIVRRRVTAAAAPGAATGGQGGPGMAAGWHPVPGDPAKTAYWDGARWTAFRQWDGRQWVEVTGHRRQETAGARPTP